MKNILYQQECAECGKLINTKDTKKGFIRSKMHDYYMHIECFKKAEELSL